MDILKKGDFVEMDGLIAVIVGTADDKDVPEDHVALWFGMPGTIRLTNADHTQTPPEVWTVPISVCSMALPAIFRH